MLNTIPQSVADIIQSDENIAGQQCRACVAHLDDGSTLIGWRYPAGESPLPESPLTSEDPLNAAKLYRQILDRLSETHSSFQASVESGRSDCQ